MVNVIEENAIAMVKNIHTIASPNFVDTHPGNQRSSSQERRIIWFHVCGAFGDLEKLHKYLWFREKNVHQVTPLVL